MLLLDTNALIILLFGDVANSSLSSESMKSLEESDELYVSDISFWEMAIKIRINKLDINKPLNWIVDQCRMNGIKPIPVTVEQFAGTMELPFFKDHADPFDRLIISVAKMNNLTLVSTDEKMKMHKDEYGVSVIW